MDERKQQDRLIAEIARYSRNNSMRTMQDGLELRALSSQQTKSTPDKHVVAAGSFTWDAGSIPAASTIFDGLLVNVLTFYNTFTTGTMKIAPIEVTEKT